MSCGDLEVDAGRCSPQVYLFAEALAEGAVKMGMPSDLAHSIASQTVLVGFTLTFRPPEFSPQTHA